MRSLLGLALVLVGCNDATFDPRFRVDLPEATADGTVPQDTAGTILLRVSACVPNLPSARVSIVSLNELGDGGPATRTAVLLAPTTAPADCAEGALQQDVRLPAPPEGGALDLEVSGLGSRVVEAVTVAPRAAGVVGDVTFTPASMPPAGGIVTVSVSAADAPDGTIVQVRTVPMVPLSTSSPRVRAGVAELVMSVPDDVAGVWVEAKIGASTATATVQRAAP